MLVTTYLDPVFNIEQYAQIMKIVEKFLSQEKFDSIAFRGTSGCAVAFPLALSMKKEMLHVRKSGGHSCASIEGQTEVKTYAVIDDFVETGSTLETIKDKISNWYLQSCRKEPACTVVFLYNESCSDDVVNTIDKLFPNAIFYALRSNYLNYSLYTFPAKNRRNCTIKTISFEDGEMVIEYGKEE